MLASNLLPPYYQTEQSVSDCFSSRLLPVFQMAFYSKKNVLNCFFFNIFNILILYILLQLKAILKNIMRKHTKIISGDTIIINRLWNKNQFRV